MRAASAAAYRPRITIVEPDAGVAWVMTKFRQQIRGMARRLAPEDPRFWPDLIQEGEIALWEARHWRLDLAEPEDMRYLRKRVKRCMRNAHGVMHRQAYPKVRKPDVTAKGNEWHVASERVGMNHVVRAAPMAE